MAEDARIRKTKEKLSAAFVALLQGQKFEDVTPAKICERAGINRSTFYRNYRNTTELKEEIEQKILSGVEWSGSFFDFEYARKRILKQLEYLQEKKDTFGVLSSGAFEDSIFQKLNIKLINGAMEKYDAYSGMISYQDYENECIFYICAMVGIIYTWYKGGMVQSPEKLTDYILKKLAAGFLKI